MSVASDAVRHQVQLRVAALRALPYAALRRLPEWQTEDLPFGAVVATVTTYRTVRDDGVLEVVVQCLPEGRNTGAVWRGVVADGFLAHPSGAIEALPEGDRHYYM